MSNQATISTIFSATVTSPIISGYTIKAPASSNNSVNINSAITATTQSVGLNTFSMVATGSIGIVQTIYIKNLTTSSIVDVANNSGGTQKVSLLPYNAGLVFYPSASQGLWVSGLRNSASIQVLAVGY